MYISGVIKRGVWMDKVAKIIEFLEFDYNTNNNRIDMIVKDYFEMDSEKADTLIRKYTAQNNYIQGLLKTIKEEL